MSTTADILDGLAAWLAANVTPTVVWNPSGAYTTSQTGIFRKVVPIAPDRILALTVVPQSDDPSMPLGRVMIQIRGRGLPNKPNDVDDLLDSVFDVLHGRTDLTFGAATLIQINREIRAPMGQDDSKRWETADQYYTDVDYPPTVTRPERGSW